jgi:hypothetical protein
LGHLLDIITHRHHIAGVSASCPSTLPFCVLRICAVITRRSNGEKCRISRDPADTVGQEFKYVGGVHGYSLSSDFRPYNPAVWEPPIENLNPLLNPYHVPGIAGRLYDIRNRDIDKPGYDPRPRDYNLQNRRKALLWPEELPFFVGLYEKAVFAKANGIPYVPIEPKESKEPKRPHHEKRGVSDFQDSKPKSWTSKISNDIPATPDLSPSRSSSLNTQSGSEKGSAVSLKIPRPPREYKEQFVDAEGEIHDIK